MDNELDESGLEPQTEETVADSSPVEQSEEQTSKKEIMVPKWRLDEVTQKLQEARNQPKPKEEKPNVNVEEVVQRYVAPLKVKIETQEVLNAHPDFKDFAQGALNRIQKNPSLSLEDAYKLEKFEAIQSTAKEEGKKEAYQTIEKKENLSFETSGPKKSATPVSDLLKDKTVPLSEIAKMLPRS